MKKYNYRRKDNGTLVQSDTPLKDKNLKPVAIIRDGKIKAAEVTRKRIIGS